MRWKRSRRDGRWRRRIWRGETRWRRRMRIFGIESDRILMIYWYVLLLYFSIAPRRYGDVPIMRGRGALKLLMLAQRPMNLTHRVPQIVSPAGNPTGQNWGATQGDMIKFSACRSSAVIALDVCFTLRIAMPTLFMQFVYSSSLTTQ